VNLFKGEKHLFDFIDEELTLKGLKIIYDKVGNDYAKK